MTLPVAPPLQRTALDSWLEDFKGLKYPAAEPLRQMGLSDLQVASVQRSALTNIALTVALIGGGLSLGFHLKGPIGGAAGLALGVVLNHARHNISLFVK